MRKTAYLLGVWAGAQDMDLMTSARHRSKHVALRYKKDASAMLELTKRQMKVQTMRGIVPE